MIKDGVYYPLGCSEGMSEGEYQAMYDNLVSEVYLPAASLSEKIGYWQKRDGSVIKITEMSITHIKNAIGLFDRVGWGDHSKIRELREELSRRTP